MVVGLLCLAPGSFFTSHLEQVTGQLLQVLKTASASLSSAKQQGKALPVTAGQLAAGHLLAVAVEGLRELAGVSLWWFSMNTTTTTASSSRSSRSGLHPAIRTPTGRKDESFPHGRPGTTGLGPTCRGGNSWNDTPGLGPLCRSRRTPSQIPSSSSQNLHTASHPLPNRPPKSLIEQRRTPKGRGDKGLRPTPQLATP